MLVGFGLDEQLREPVEVHCYYTTGFLVTLRRAPSPALDALRQAGSVQPQLGSDPIRALQPLVGSLYTQFSALALELEERLDALEQRVLREADDQELAEITVIRHRAAVTPEDRGAGVPVSVVEVQEAVTQAHHEEWARVVASLTRRFGDLDIAEEAAAEAFATAVQRWPADGVPPNPGAWLTTTAIRKAIDWIRRENKRDDKQQEAQLLYDDDPPEPAGAIDDERLRLIFTCCHPALAMETRVALTLRMVAGLTVPEIARAFLVQETAMGQRITRAKAKIKAARIPYRVPSAEDLPARVSGVLAVLFLVFNEGYLATGPDTDPVRHDLIAEAIRLTRLIRALMPEDGEVAGLLALMLLTEARRTARVSAGGELVTLVEQDRGTWDAALIAEGHRLVRERLAARVAPGRYQILAAISAVHTSARDVRDTD